MKLTRSKAFDVVVVDYDSIAYVRPAPEAERVAGTPRVPRNRKNTRPEVLIRKLALLAEEAGTTLVLLTDTTAPRPLPWPVALRLELTRAPETLHVKVTKDRFCRLGTASIPWNYDLYATH